MITHITVEDAAKLISRIAGTNEMQALTYIREAADRGEIQAADGLEKLQAELQKSEHDNVNLTGELAKVAAELEQVKAELNAAKSPEVLEAVDELMEFARTRMSTADWLYYVDVLGEWRGQKED